MNNDVQTSKAESRTQVQRDRILAAAQTCFVRSGFHAASMATIAETAGMSAGLIYRYFDNKSAIVLAIIEQQLEVARTNIRQMRSSDDLAARIVDHCDEDECGDEKRMSTALFLEMSAEATRDPQIAEAVQRFDRMVRSEVEDWLGRSSDSGGYGLPKAVAPGRALMLVCLIEGLKVRVAREPCVDQDLLRGALDDMLAALVDPG